MVIVDTSIWVTHLRRGSRHLEELLLDAKVVCHPFVIGELACGNLRNRDEFLDLLQSLPMTPTVLFNELLYFIDTHSLMGKGLGFVDANLLASAHLSGIPLWTSDKRLRSAATELELAYRQSKVMSRVTE
ncbi:MAG: PIN domain-containing protein [Deltaproteobacteria bacterium]|nr:PIN domain-containing protein [Deltaproteobacteria bacterium]MBW2072988.1 PIN domain-containing protein [Deltaproteobacteria bacterium]